MCTTNSKISRLSSKRVETKSELAGNRKAAELSVWSTSTRRTVTKKSTMKLTIVALVLDTLIAFGVADIATAAVPTPNPVAEKPTLADLFPMQEPGNISEAEPGFADPIKVDEGLGRERISSVPGELIDPRTGLLQLSARDLVVDGNGGMALVVSRSRRTSFYAGQSDTYVGDGSIQEQIADWALDIPNIELRSVYDYKQSNTIRWHSPLSNDLRHLGGLAQGACASPYPPHPSYKGETTGVPNPSPSPLAYMGPVRLRGISGQPERELLIRTEQRTLYIDSRYATSDYWIARCEGSEQVPGVVGKFVVNSPDGTTYYFDQSSKGNNLAPTLQFPFFGKMRVFVSRIVDHNGNWIQYEYDDTLFSKAVLDTPGYGRATPDLRDFAYVKRIHTSDGREVTFDWEVNPFAPAGQPACRGSEFGTCGSPRYRLKQFNHDGKRWQFFYNDAEPGPDAARYLKSVQLPNGQTYQYRVTAGPASTNLPPCRGYPYSGEPGEWLRPINYQVTFPAGAVVDYSMNTRRFERRGNGSGSCWYASALSSRQVSDLVGAPAITQWCYSSADRSEQTSWTYMLSPTRWEAYNFEREGSDGGWWGEGQLYSHQVREPIAQCPSTIGDPGPGYLRKTSNTHVRGGIISRPDQGSVTFAPGYAAAVVAPRPVEKVVIDQPGSGVFETSLAKFDLFTVPVLARESLVGQPSTAASARRWRSTYDHRAVRFDLNVNSNRAFGRWFSAGQTAVEFWASRNGGTEFLVHSGTGSSNDEELFNVDNFVPGNGTFTFTMYPAGQHVPERKLAEFTNIVIDSTAIQRHSTRSWLLALPVERCVVGTDDGVCPVVDGVVQSDRAYYDFRGNQISQISYGKASGQTYTTEGDVEARVDANNNATTFSSYKRGIPQLIVLPGSNAQESESLIVNDNGTIARIVNAAGIPTDYLYDALGRLASVDYYQGADTTIVWSPDGRRRTSTRGNLEVVSEFDGFGRLVKQSTRDATRAGTVTNEYDYDAVGRVVFESYPATGGSGSTDGLRYEYDALDRQVRAVRTTDQVFSTIDFQPPEKQISRDFGGRTTTRSYRSYGAPSYEQLLRVEQPYTAKDENGTATARTATTTFDPDMLGFVQSVSQGGMARRYALDGRRLLTREFAPELGPPPVKAGYNIGYCRDDMGQVTGKTIGGSCISAAAAGLVTNHYDARGRKDSVNYHDTASPDLTINYTATGRIRTATKGSASTDYFYDEMENLKREAHRLDSQIFTLRYTYDDLNNLASITYPSGKRYTVISDALGRVREVPGILSAVGYHATGQVSTMTFQNGQVTRLALTANNQPDTLVTQGAEKTLVSLDYAYDAVGNAISVVNRVRPEYSLEAIGYDELDRLTETRYAVSEETYRRGYDDIGNVRFDQSPELPMLHFTYDGNNRLTTLSGSLSRALTYDQLGNIQTDGVRNMTFGYDGNLMHASTSKAAKTMVYDGRDRLLREDGPLGTIYYVYSGERLMLEYYPAQKKYIEYLYVGPLLISSRTVEQAHLADADGDGVNDVSEFLGLGQPAD